MNKEILFGEASRIKMKKGIDTLADAVKVTFGAKGRTVIIGNPYGEPHITKDGATVAKAISSEDLSEELGISMIKGVAEKTAEIAGDGTTTATILTQSIVNQGFKLISAGANPVDLKKGIDKATIAVVEKLKSMTIETNEAKLEQIATVSANGDTELGRIIGQTYAKLGKDGVIDFDDSPNFDTYAEVVEGMNFDKGFISPYFRNNSDKNICEFENPLILLVEGRITMFDDILGIIEKAVVDAKKPLLIIAEDVTDNALNTLIINRLKSAIPVAAVKAPGFGDRRRDILEDIAILTGAKVISVFDKLKDAGTDVLGKAKKVIIDKNSTSIIKGAGKTETVKERIELIRKRLAEETSVYDKEKLEERLAKMSGGIAVLYVGAPTDAELKEKKDRVEDAIRATKGAIQEGVIAGGGTALIRCSEALNELKYNSDDEKYGIEIVRTALEAPLKQLCYNAGEDISYIVRKVKDSKGDFGYNVITGKFENMIKSGIIDATKVTRVALENAASVASMILISECSVAEILQINQV